MISLMRLMNTSTELDVLAESAIVVLQLVSTITATKLSLSNFLSGYIVDF